MKRRWYTVGVLSLVLLAAPAFAQHHGGGEEAEADEWQQFMDSAREARENGDKVQTEKYLQLALKFAETPAGNVHLGTSLNNLAVFYATGDRFADATPLLTRALRVWEATLGPEDPEVARGCTNLATLYLNQQKFAEAEPLFRRALAIHEKASGADDPMVAKALLDLGEMYTQQKKFAEAEDLFKKAIAIVEAKLGSDHLAYAISLDYYVRLLRETNRGSEAEPMAAKAKVIFDRKR